MDLRRFLSEHPPFASLDGDALDALASTAEIEFFPAGSVVLSGDETAGTAYVIRVGAVEVVDDGTVVDLLAEGDVFGAMAYGRAAAGGVVLRANEDTLCYLLESEAIARAFGGRPRGRRVAVHVLAGLDTRWADVSAIGSLVHRPPVTCSPTATVREAAALMAAERVSSVLVAAPEHWGIVTDRDLRTRVLAAGLSRQTPIGEVMTTNVVVAPADTSAEEALLLMLEHGFHHVPVVNARGDVIGMVSDTDLLALERASPFALKSEIERASSRAAVVSLGARLPDVVAALVDARMDAVAIGRVMSVGVDALTRRLLELAIAELGGPPAGWAWLAFGSQARREQALRTDQDHGLAIDAAGPLDSEVDGYFELLAGAVTDGLERAGIARCPGRVMAENPAMRRSTEGWRRAFSSWIEAPDRHGSEATSIVFDYRRVAGPLDAAPALDDVVAGAGRSAAFVRHLAHRALDERPPIGFFGHVLVEARGAHAGRFDVKHRGVALVSSLARLDAILAGSLEKSTLTRLRAARSGGVIDDESAEALDEAFRLLWNVRLEHQRTRLADRAAPDDFVDPRTLGAVTRRALREAFEVIAGAQRTVALELDIR